MFISAINKSVVSLLFCLILGSGIIQAQTYRLRLEDRVLHSPIIIEAKVDSKEAYWSPRKDMIFTAYRLSIHEVMKGTVTGSNAILIVRGGKVGDFDIEVSHSLNMEVGAKGVLFLQPTKHPLPPFAEPNTTAFAGFAGMQSFVKYASDSHDGLAVDPFHKFYDVKCLIRSILNDDMAECKMPGAAINQEGGIIIDMIDPPAISAGTREELQVVGSGFGNTAGAVGFRNADNDSSWIITMPTDILGWSDTLIKVWVPTSGAPAGDGQIRVYTAAGDSAQSTDSLDITYAIRNARHGNSNKAFPVDLGNMNGIGGYTFQYNSSFRSDSGAVEVFNAALSKWRCATGVNFGIGANTAVDTTLLDAVNSIHWLQAAVPGELGSAVFYQQGFTNGPLGYYVTLEVDFEFPRTFDSILGFLPTWHFDAGVIAPSDSAFDFFTAALHEIGHAHSIKHIIDDRSIMQWSLMRGDTIRTLSTEDIAAGIWVMDSALQLNELQNPAGIGVMSEVPQDSCQIMLESETRLIEVSPEMVLFPQPASENVALRLSLSAPDALSLKVVDATGRNLWHLPKRKYTPGEHFISLNEVTQFPSGIYFVVVESSHAVLAQKLILTKAP
jgi:hypothetical protein